MDYDDVKPLLDELLDYDCITFADVVAATQQSIGGQFGFDVIRQAAEVAAHFVREGVLIAGVLAKGGFQAWSTPPEESAARITVETAELIERGEYVQDGDIVWLAMPEQVVR